MTVHNFEPLYHELLSERRFLGAALDLVDEGIIVCDEGGNTTYLNRAARELFGLSSGLPAGEFAIADSTVFAGDSQTPLEAEAMPLQRTLREGSIERVDLVVHKGAGEPRKVLADGRTLRGDDGALIGAVVTLRDITHIERLTAESLDYEARFWGAFKNASIGVAMVRPDGRLIEVNEALCTILGYSEHELRTLSFQDITHHEDLDDSIGFLHRLLSKEVDSVGFEKRYLHKKGHTVWADVWVSSVEDSRGDIRYFITQIVDTTERRRILEALETSERNFRSIFDSQPSAVLYTDARGRILESNPAVNHLLGYDPRELIGRNLWVLYDRAAEDDLLAEVRARSARKASPWERVCDLIRKNGKTLPCAVTGSGLRDASGEVIGYVWLVRDLSAQRRAEEELAETYERLANSREQERLHLARELHDSSVQDLIAIGYRLATLQRAAGRDDEQLFDTLAEVRNDVVEVVKQLRSVISELRPADLEEFGFAEALEGYVARLERGLDGRMPAVHLDIDASVDDLPSPMTLCLFRAAQEALSNTVKHAEASQVQLRLLRLEGEVVLVIEDDGKGFDIPDDLRDLTRDDHFGLAGIAERVELMRGILTLRSQHGRGTELSVTLRLTEEEDV